MALAPGGAHGRRAQPDPRPLHRGGPRAGEPRLRGPHHVGGAPRRGGDRHRRARVARAHARPRPSSPDGGRPRCLRSARCGERAHQPRPAERGAGGPGVHARRRRPVRGGTRRRLRPAAERGVGGRVRRPRRGGGTGCRRAGAAGSEPLRPLRAPGQVWRSLSAQLVPRRPEHLRLVPRRRRPVRDLRHGGRAAAAVAAHRLRPGAPPRRRALDLLLARRLARLPRRRRHRDRAHQLAGA